MVSLYDAMERERGCNSSSTNNPQVWQRQCRRRNKFPCYTDMLTLKARVVSKRAATHCHAEKQCSNVSADMWSHPDAQPLQPCTEQHCKICPAWKITFMQFSSTRQITTIRNRGSFASFSGLRLQLETITAIRNISAISKRASSCTQGSLAKFFELYMECHEHVLPRACQHTDIKMSSCRQG